MSIDKFLVNLLFENCQEFIDIEIEMRGFKVNEIYGFEIRGRALNDGLTVQSSFCVFSRLKIFSMCWLVV